MGVGTCVGGCVGKGDDGSTVGYGVEVVGKGLVGSGVGCGVGRGVG